MFLCDKFKAWEACFMLLLPDDPIVACMESRGYPPWLCFGGAFEEDEEDEEDGN